MKKDFWKWSVIRGYNKGYKVENKEILIDNKICNTKKMKIPRKNLPKSDSKKHEKKIKPEVFYIN